MKTILKKMTALFASALILLTALPVSASAQSRIQIENADVFGTTQEIVIGDGLFIDHRNYWCMMHTTDSMRAVYCLEPGRSVSSGDVYETDDTYSYLDYVQNPTLTSAEIQQLLKRVFQHAYTGNLDTAESYFQYVATQLLVWEVVVGQRDMNFEFADNGYDSVSLVLTCFENSYAADKVGKYYLQYEEAIKNHAESVSSYLSEYDAEEFVVEADENNMYTFIDDNAVLSQFKVTVMGGHIIKLTDSTLQIQVDTGETAWITMTAKNDGIGFVTLALESHQTLAELCVDTPVYYATVKAAPVVTTETTTTTTTTETTTATTEITTTSTSSEVTTTTSETTLSTTTTQTTNSSLQTTPATTTSTTQATTSQTTPITTTTEQMTSTTTTTLMSQTTATSSENTFATTDITSESTITNTEMTTEVTSTTTKATENTTTTSISTVTSAGTTVTSTTTGTGKTIPSAPNVPKQDTPSTGDERTSVLPLVFAGMGIALIAGVLFLDKKVHSHEEKK